MEFGVFDHLDLGDRPHERFYRERLEIVEAYERAGFYSYHVAEHHLTPLGMAPSPSVFLAAVAQRTRRLRFGPMVYVAPLYHRLRLLEEICMLDQLSGGRLEIAFGRGALPAEVRFFDVDPAQTEKVHQEMVGFILEGLSEGAVTVTVESGKRRLPLAIPPLQKPHPPLWYGVHSPEAAERVARRGMNVVGLDTVAELKPCFERFRAVWRETRGEAPLPRIGLGRFIVVGKNAGAARPAAPQGYPSKTVKIVVGTSPGGSPDVSARLIAQKMSESWGSVVIENRIGANGNIAAEMVSKSAPDGYTAYVCDSAIWAINPHLYAKVPYRPLADFAGITTISTLPTFLTVHPSVPATTYAEFIAYARQNPGKLAYASAGNGSIHHTTTELFKSLAGISMVHVPYKGMGQAGPALIAGDVQVAFSSYTAMAQYARAGKVRILASADGKRTPALPDIPTIAELGIPGFDMASILGALVPAGVPRDIVAKLNAGVVAAVASPEVHDKIAGFGVRIGTSTPEQFDALMRADNEKYAKLVKLSGARLD